MTEARKGNEAVADDELLDQAGGGHRAIGKHASSGCQAQVLIEPSCRRTYAYTIIVGFPFK